jgi:hypothetical protein
MKVITPIAPAIPATTAIQDPAARRFAQAVSDAISAMQSSEGSVRTLTKAAEALSGAAAGGVPPGIAQWLFSSELYAKLSSEIVRVDLAAKQQTIAEAFARQEAIDAIQATLADIGSTAAYDPGITYAVSDMVTFDGKLYRAKVATTGNLPTDTAFWEKVGDYATLGDVVAAHTLSINDHESRIDATEAGLSAEVFERSSLAAQVRGGYSGTDANAVTQGLIYSERIARASADSTEVAARQSLSAKLTGATDPTGLTLGTLASGLVFDEKTARVSAVSAVATSVSVLEGRTSATEGAILAEQSVRAGNDNALVSAINTMWAITGATTAISTSGSNLVTNWTSGQANYWNTLNAEVFTTGGQTIRAALSQEATVRASQTGELYGQYTVKIDTNGYVAGFGLASSSSTAGVGTSSFVIRADKFAMVMPGYGDYVPFAVGPVGVSFNGNTNWSGVTGTGKPSDNATYGADASNLNVGLGVNLLPNTEFIGGFTPAVLGWNPGGVSPLALRGDDAWRPKGGQALEMFQLSRNGNVYNIGADTYLNGPYGDYHYGIPVTAGKRYEFSAKLAAHRCDYWLSIVFFDAAGTTLEDFGSGFITPRLSGGPTFSENAHGSGWTHAVIFRTAPDNAAFASVYWRKSDTDVGEADSYAWLTQPFFGEALASQTAPSTYSPGYAKGAFSSLDKLTTNNIATYMDNAVIGNAQIGGNIWSSNYVAGSAGWIIDRTGYAEFRNILARGNIEATSIKADTVDIVGTLHLQGEAVTVPRSAYTAAEIGVGTGTTVQSCYINAAGQPVSITGSITALIISNGASTALVLELYAPGGSLISSGNAGAGMAGLPLLCTISVGGVCSEVGTYTLKTKTYAGSAFYASNRFLQLLGTKR